MTAACDGGFCVAKFGKKNDKKRTIEILTCLIYSNGRNILAAVNMVEENEDVYEFFMPPASSEEVVGVVYSIFTWTKDFRVASGAPLNVIK